MLENHTSVIVLRSKENSCLVQTAMTLHRDSTKSGTMLFLSQKESSFVQETLRSLEETMPDFKAHKAMTRFLFLKEAWSVLDTQYGKTFFINEIQKIMQEETFETLYFHRLDTFFDGCSQKDGERMISDIVEIARYYHKKVIFSLSEQTRMGAMLSDALYGEADLELGLERNLQGVCERTVQKIKKENAHVVLFSNHAEMIAFHEYLFKKDPHIHFEHVQNFEDKNKKNIEDADIIIYNLPHVGFKDQLLAHIKKQKLKTKFLYLSDETVIRKRDKVVKIEKGISHLFEKQFDLLEYIYTIEKIIGRAFYTNILHKVKLTPQNHYMTHQEPFQKVVYDFTNYYLYFSVAAFAYQSPKPLEQSVVEGCIRELDVVYHDEAGRQLLFLMVDMLPQNALSLVKKRLLAKNITIVSQQVFDAQTFANLTGVAPVGAKETSQMIQK